MTLNWMAGENADRNTVWLAASSRRNHHWRVSPMVRANEIAWTLNTSSPSLLGKRLFGRQFDTPEEAKMAAQDAEDEIAKETQ